MARLRQALAIAAGDPPEIVAGDYVELLPSLLADRDPGAPTVVFQTVSTIYLEEDRYAELRRIVDEAGARPWRGSRRVAGRRRDGPRGRLRARSTPGRRRAARLVARMAVPRPVAGLLEWVRCVITSASNPRSGLSGGWPLGASASASACSSARARISSPPRSTPVSSRCTRSSTQRGRRRTSWTAWRKRKGLRRRSWARSRRSATARASLPCSVAVTFRAAAVGGGSRSGASRIPATSARSCARPTPSARASSRSPRGAPTRRGRRRSGPPPARSSACRSSRSTTRLGPGRRSRPAAARRSRSWPCRPVQPRARRGARGPAGGHRRVVRRGRDDPAAGARRVAQRRHGRVDRALRVGAPARPPR